MENSLLNGTQQGSKFVAISFGLVSQLWFILGKNVNYNKVVVPLDCKLSLPPIQQTSSNNGGGNLARWQIQRNKL